MSPLRWPVLGAWAMLAAASGAGQETPPAAPPPAVARPVAGGQIEPAVPGGSPPFSDSYGYEVWRSTDGDVWIDLSVNPSPGSVPGATPPTVRLPFTVLHTLDLAASRHNGVPTVRAVGVGVSDGAVSMTLSQRWPLASLAALFVALALLGLAAWGRRARRRARTLAEVARHQTASREDERARVAREIHDGPIQDLVQLAVTLGGPSSQDPVPPHVARRLQEVGHDLRALAAGLRPPALDHLGLPAALDDLAERWADAPVPLAVRLTCDALPPLRPDAELAVYRVVQEALANASAHGQARTAWVFVRVRDRGRPFGSVLDVVVRDDGRGLPPYAAAGHFGLVGMAERAREVGASLSLSPGPGRVGTQVRLVGPLRRLVQAPARVLSGARPAAALPLDA